MPELWKVRFRRLLWLGVVSVFGLAILLPGNFLDLQAPIVLIAIGGLLFAPGAVYLLILTIWHWKTRYRGEHSDLWGALLLLETSGWFKLIYLFRHMIPEARGTGRYARCDELQP